jgi:hypothetical protein
MMKNSYIKKILITIPNYGNNDRKIRKQIAIPFQVMKPEGGITTPAKKPRTSQIPPPLPEAYGAKTG